jgi:hypothetical protein
VIHSLGHLLRGEDGRLLESNSPHSFFGHATLQKRDLACHCCEAKADNGRQLHMRLYTVMDEAAANLFRRASPPVLAARTRTYAVSGRTAEARNLLDQLMLQSKKQ